MKTCLICFAVFVNLVIHLSNGFAQIKNNNLYQYKPLDSLLKIYKEIETDTAKDRLCLEIGNYYQNSNPDSSIIYYNKIFVRSKSQLLLAQTLHNISWVYCVYKGKYDTAIVLSRRALKIYSELEKKTERISMQKIKAGISYSNNVIGVAYWYKGDYIEAIESIQKSLKIDVSLNNYKGIAKCYNNIGLIYYSQKSYEKAIGYYLNAVQYLEKLQEKKGLALCYNNIGLVYGVQGNNSKYGTVQFDRNYNQSLLYFQKSLIYFEDIGDKKGISLSYLNIGETNANLRNYSKAIDCYAKSLKICEGLDDKNGVALVLGSIAEMHLKISDVSNISFADKNKHLKEALLNGLESYKVANQINAKPVIISATSTLMKVYKLLDNTEKAFEFAEIFISTRDSMFQEEKTKAITEMEAKYQNEKKQKEVELLQKDNDLKIHEIEQQRLLRNSFVVGFALILIFAIITLRYYRQKKKANILLVEKNEEIKQQYEEIQTQSDQLELINQELEKLSIVASETENAVIIFNVQGVIEWVNAGFTKLYGYTSSEFISTHGANIIRASTSPEINDAIFDCVCNKVSVVYSSTFQTKSGERLWIQTTLTPILDYGGEVVKMVAIDSDITKIKLAEEEIKQQSDIIFQKNVDLLNKNKIITDSINYAKIIQDAILPPIKQFETAFQDFFIIFKPRDIVSGDFFWLREKNDMLYFAVVDCTGHGVPGAFMSMIGNTILNEILDSEKNKTPATMLDELNKKVLFALGQGGDGSDSKGDGMDISLCCINKKLGEIQVSSAKQKVYYTINDEIFQITGDMFSIGSNYNIKRNWNYSNHTLKIEPGMHLYLATDGFPDQIGGLNNDKFQSKQFKNLIKDNSNKSVEEQQKNIELTFDQWKGNHKQIDDVTLLCVKL